MLPFRPGAGEIRQVSVNKGKCQQWVKFIAGKHHLGTQGCRTLARIQNLPPPCRRRVDASGVWAESVSLLSNRCGVWGLTASGAPCEWVGHVSVGRQHLRKVYLILEPVKLLVKLKRVGQAEDFWAAWHRAGTSDSLASVRSGFCQYSELIHPFF